MGSCRKREPVCRNASGSPVVRKRYVPSRAGSCSIPLRAWLPDEIAKLTIGSGDGRTLVLHVAHAGEALGLASVMSGHDHKTTAEALEPTQIRFIKRDDFLRLSAEYHEACRHTAVQLSDECEASAEQVRAIGLAHSAAEKLAHLFLTWCDESGKETEEGVRVPMLMTHHDMAQLIGTSRETVTRLLTEAGAAPRQSAIGSVKTLIGHTKATAGVAGLIKATLATHHGVLPPHGRVDKPNKALADPQSPLHLIGQPQPWIADETVGRRAAVSASLPLCAVATR